MKFKHLHEILEMAGKKRKKADKIAVLQEYDCVALRNLLRGSYDATIKWNLPEGSPPYESPKEVNPKNIHDMCTVMGQWTLHGGARVPSYKREQSFINVLNKIHAEDAKLLIAMKDKELTIKGITPAIIDEAFPGMIQEMI